MRIVISGGEKWRFERQVTINVSWLISVPVKIKGTMKRCEIVEIDIERLILIKDGVLRGKRAE